MCWVNGISRRNVRRYPFAPALRPIREVLAKLDPTPAPEPLPPRNACRASAAKEEQAAALRGTYPAVHLTGPMGLPR